MRIINYTVVKNEVSIVVQNDRGAYELMIIRVKMAKKFTLSFCH